jgi:hypothetical protein
MTPSSIGPRPASRRALLGTPGSIDYEPETVREDLEGRLRIPGNRARPAPPDDGGTIALSEADDIAAMRGPQHAAEGWLVSREQTVQRTGDIATGSEKRARSSTSGVGILRRLKTESRAAASSDPPSTRRRVFRTRVAVHPRKRIHVSLFERSPLSTRRHGLFKLVHGLRVPTGHAQPNTDSDTCNSRHDEKHDGNTHFV